MFKNSTVNSEERKLLSNLSSLSTSSSSSSLLNMEYYQYRQEIENILLREPNERGSIIPISFVNVYQYHMTQTSEYLFVILSRLSKSCALFMNNKILMMFNEEDEDTEHSPTSQIEEKNGRKHSAQIDKRILKLVRILLGAYSASSLAFLYCLKSGSHDFILTFDKTLLSNTPQNFPFISPHHQSLKLNLCKTNLKWLYETSSFKNELISLWRLYITTITGLILNQYTVNIDPDASINNLVLNVYQVGKCIVFVADNGCLYVLKHDNIEEKVIFTALTLIFIWLYRKSRDYFEISSDCLTDQTASATAQCFINTSEKKIKKTQRHDETFADETLTDSCSSPNAFLHLVARLGAIQNCQPLPIENCIDRLVRILKDKPAINHQRLAIEFYKRGMDRMVFTLAQVACWLGLYGFCFQYQNKIYYSSEFMEYQEHLFIFSVTDDHLMSFLLVDHTLPTKKHVYLEHINKYGSLLHSFWPLELNMELIYDILDLGQFNQLVQYVDKTHQPGTVVQFIKHEGLSLILDKPCISNPYIQSENICNLMNSFEPKIMDFQDLYTQINVIHSITRLNILAVHKLNDDKFYAKFSFGGIRDVYLYTPVTVSMCNKTYNVYFMPMDKSGKNAINAFENLLNIKNVTEKADALTARKQPDSREIKYTAIEQTLGAFIHYKYSNPKVELTTEHDSLSVLGKMLQTSQPNHQVIQNIKYTDNQITLRTLSELNLLRSLVLPQKMRNQKDVYQKIIANYRNYNSSSSSFNFLESNDPFIKFLIYSSPFKYFHFL